MWALTCTMWTLITVLFAAHKPPQSFNALLFRVRLSLGFREGVGKVHQTQHINSRVSRQRPLVTLDPVICLGLKCSILFLTEP